MRNKIRSNFYFIVVLLGFLPFIPQVLAEETKEYPSLVPTQSNQQILSLQDQINQAEPGSTLVLPTGTYHEVLTISKPLHLKGNGTILSPTSGENGYAIQITAEGVILSDLEILNQAPGLYTTAVKISAPSTTIDHCSIHDTPIGIAIWSTNTIISNSTFHHCEDEGIVLLGTQKSPCTNNTIASCIFTENCDGIELQHASDNHITTCSFQRNTHAGIDAIEADNNNNIISDCTFSDNDAFGVYLAYSTQNLITRCDFSDDHLTLIYAPQNTLQQSHIHHIHLFEDSSLILDQCIDTIAEHITAEHSTYIVQSITQQQDLGNQAAAPARYYQALMYLLAHLKTFKTFLDQYFDARM